MAGKNNNQNATSVDNIMTTKKYLVFRLGKERFGVELSSVKEVIGLIDITEIPQVPSFFKGLINIRGKIISVIDLRLKMGLEATKYQSKKTSIIVTEIQRIIVGLIVDDIEEVASYQKEKQIEESINVQGKISKKFILGVAKDENKNLVLLMDTAQILNSDDLAIIQKEKS